MLQKKLEKVEARVRSLLSDLLSENPKEDWDEVEYKPIEGLGYLAWLNEDNGGSFSIFVTKEDLKSKSPFWVGEEENRKVEFTSFKVVVKGDWVSGIPNGTVYYNLVDHSYIRNEDFTNEEEVIQILTERILELV